MNGMGAAFRCELLKARRSLVPRVVLAGFTFAPVVSALFMVIMKDPERARSWGLISTKAQLFAGTADWPTYLGLLGQTIAVGGWLLFSVLAAWVFGREFADRTAKTFLAVPTPRSAIVAAKLLLVTLLSLALAAWVLVLGIGLGALIGLPGGSASVMAGGVGRACAVAVLTVALTTPVALVAGMGRGYLVPLGTALLLLFLAQIVAATGWGEWLPWAVPALLSGAAGPDAAVVSVWSFVLIAAVSVAGAWLTFRWWRTADHAG